MFSDLYVKTEEFLFSIYILFYQQNLQSSIEKLLCPHIANLVQKINA